MRKRKTRFTIGVDPSINFCGYAQFDGKKLVEYELLEPHKLGCKSDEFYDKSVTMYNYMLEKVTDIGEKDVTVILELPSYFGSAGFMARESGSIFKLTFLCGMIYSIGCVKLYTPQEWKGQMPKKVVANRLVKFYPIIKGMNHNIVDAIGLAHKHLHGRV